MDMRVYHSYELQRIAQSSGASDALRYEIAAEIVARIEDPTREPGYVVEKDAPSSRAPLTARKHQRQRDLTN